MSQIANYGQLGVFWAEPLAPDEFWRYTIREINFASILSHGIPTKP